MHFDWAMRMAMTTRSSMRVNAILEIGFAILDFMV